MSRNPPEPSSPNNRRGYRLANELIYAILDDRPSTATVSPSGELYRFLERRVHRSLDPSGRLRLARRELSGTTADRQSPAAPVAPAASALASAPASAPAPAPAPAPVPAPAPAPAPAPGNTSMSSGSSERDLRRRFNRDPPTSNSPLIEPDLELPSISSISPSHTPSLPPLRSLGSRRLTDQEIAFRRFERAAERAQRSNDAYQRRNRVSSQSNIDDLGRLDDANSHLRALLDFTNNNPISPSISRAMSPTDYHDDGRRTKRRRLDSDKTAQIFKGFRYGKYGQSEPGQLTMELVSCDGGMYSNEPAYAAENILKNDSSVYCTKGNRCNIVLRHQGATTFSLEELVIKAPGSNFSSPVREGMIFISMDSDELFTRTAQYQIQYLTPRDAAERLGGAERDSNSNTRDPPTVYSIRHNEDGTSATRIPPGWPPRNDSPMDFDGDGDNDDDAEPPSFRVAQLPAEFTAEPPPFRITTECSNDEADDAAGGGNGSRYNRNYGRLPVPNRIGVLPFESGDESDEDDDDDDDNNDNHNAAWAHPSGSGSAWANFDELARGHYDRRRRPAATTSRSLAEAREASQIATQEAVRAVGGGLMTPLCHFHVEKGKNVCSLRFEPPVSGRFLLLKMWSPRHEVHGNIDIQGVTVRGFAGPRFWSDVEYR